MATSAKPATTPTPVPATTTPATAAPVTTAATPSSSAPKVSVLVPTYNTERYLPQCLDSLVGQTLSDIQIVCINDGSTDSSLDIMRDYQARDGRIVIIDKPNSGYGDSMNRGIAAATGEYIGICEPDDFSSPDQFRRLYDFASAHRCDVVKCNYYEHDEAGDREERVFDGLCFSMRAGFREGFLAGVGSLARYALGGSRKMFRYGKVFSPAQVTAPLLALPVIWAAVYRRQFLLDNGIAFNTTPGASFQDTSFVFQCWAAAERAAVIPDALPHYRVDNAASSSKSSSKVFAVNEEYALSEEFLARDAGRRRTFMPLLNRMKYGTYAWNFNRIAPECRAEFAARWAGEYRAARQAGELDRLLFPDDVWEQAALLMEDTDAFVARYGTDGIPVL